MRTLDHIDIARGFVSQLDKLGSKQATKQLASLILENRMHNQTGGILDCIQTEYQRVHGIIEATTVSVHPLTAELKKNIQAVITKKTNAKKVILHELLDPGVLGGVKITAPEMELDLTLKTKLAKLRA